MTQFSTVTRYLHTPVAVEELGSICMSLSLLHTCISLNVALLSVKTALAQHASRKQFYEKNYQT